ncbi:MAG: hypothetical protein ACR2RB_12835 [Gammaproteobacteria bacterium]
MVQTRPLARELSAQISRLEKAITAQLKTNPVFEVLGLHPT